MKRKQIIYNGLVKPKSAAWSHPGNLFVPIVEIARHSVISIETKDKQSTSPINEFLYSFLFPESEEVNGPTRSFGTGFIIHPNGYVLTSD